MAKLATVDISQLSAELKRVYDLYRESCLNVKYYGYKLHRLRQWSFGIDLLIVAASATSGVSGWALWKWGYGPELWAMIAAAAALVSAVRPILHLNTRIERYGKLFGGHQANFLALRDTVERIRGAGALNAAMQKEIGEAVKRHQALARDDDPHPSGKLLAKFQSAVNVQIPPEELWMPTS